MADQAAHKLCAGVCRSLHHSFPAAKLCQTPNTLFVITLHGLVKLFQISITMCARAI